MTHPCLVRPHRSPLHQLKMLRVGARRLCNTSWTGAAAGRPWRRSSVLFEVDTAGCGLCGFQPYLLSFVTIRLGWLVVMTSFFFWGGFVCGMIKITYQTIVLVRKRMKRRVCLKADEKCLNEGSSWTVKLAYFLHAGFSPKTLHKNMFFVQKLTFRAQKRWPWTNQELIDLVRYKMRCKMDCKWGVIQDWVYIDIYARTFNGQIRWDICTLNRVDRCFFFTQTSWLTKWWSAGLWLLKFRWLVLSASFFCQWHHFLCGSNPSFFHWT